MGILTRYLIRAHAGPFFFAFTALTGLLFLNAVAQRMENLVGKGLSWSVIGEFVLLSLPHTIALTLPMAILVSVLYAFSHLTSANEITAMSAGGIRPVRMLLPLVGLGIILSLGMLHFNDEILPQANHRLKNLIIDIGKKSPTLELQEQVVNEIQAEDRRGSVYLFAREIDRVNNGLTDVVIYDLSDPAAQRTTYADHGVMTFNQAQTDLYLTLYEGVTHEVRAEQVGSFNQSSFRMQIVPMRGVGTELERRSGGTFRTDREMSLKLLAWAIDGRTRELARLAESNTDRSVDAVRTALGVSSRGSERAGLGVVGRSRPGGLGAEPPRQVQRRERDSVTRSIAYDARQNLAQVELVQHQLNQYRVEWHKKFAIAYACIVFVLIGAPLAIRFPRGGIGMVIAVSVAIFAVYWAGLIGGENLADEGKVSPWLAMWGPDIVFSMLGLYLITRMGRESSTVRGGGLEERILRVRRLLSPSPGERAAA